LARRKQSKAAARGLGELEAEIMKRVWRRAEPTTACELVDELQLERSIAYTTVMTVLDNLHKKGWLERELDGRAYRYRPLSSGEQYSAQLMREALDASPDRGAAFAHFLRELITDDAKALQAAYRQLARRKQNGEDSG
jgi:predicted transcriptional regulator